MSLALFLFVAMDAQCQSDDAPVAVEGGRFVMGTAPEAIPDLRTDYDVYFRGVFENEAPAHEVEIDDFRIDPYEVSNTRYLEFVEANPAWKKTNIPADSHNGGYLSSWRDGTYAEGAGDLPVTFITWSAAQSYCIWRGGRLPTEAEWEYVARAGDEREFPWGDDRPSPDRANYSASDNGKPIAVGSYPPNDFGVYDLAGNVWEFLLDEWVTEHAVAGSHNPVAGGAQIDLNQIDMDSRRAVRGASFGGSVVNLRTRWRDSHVVSNTTEFVGFRCAYDGFSNEDAEAIRQLRHESNAAIARHDVEAIQSYIAEDYVITISTGAIERSREEHGESFAAHFAEFPDVRYIRTPSKITLSDAYMLAIEHGSWVGTRTTANGDLESGGQYTAAWRKTEHGWRIYSELFVALYCDGADC